MESQQIIFFMTATVGIVMGMLISMLVYEITNLIKKRRWQKFETQFRNEYIAELSDKEVKRYYKMVDKYNHLLRD